MAVVVLAAALAARIAIKPPIVRDFATYQPWSSAVAGLGLALVLAGALLVRKWPVLLHVVAVLTAAVLVGAWWRGRVGYGRARGWPPGSLALGRSFDAIGDRDYYRTQARLHGPVFKTSQFGRPVVCVLGLALARQVLRNDEALAGARLPYNKLIPKGSLRYMRQREHGTEAPLFRSALTNVDLEQHETIARSTCTDMLARLSAASLEADPGVVPRSYLQRWVFTSLARVFFGIGPEDERLEELFNANEGLVIARGGGPRWRRRLEQSFVTITALMRQQASAWSSAEPDRMCATVLGTVLRTDPHALDDAARARNMILVFRLGTTDLTSLLDWVLLELTEHPQWQGAVRSSGTTADASRRVRQDTVGHRVVQETLRMEQSEYLYREVVRPFAINGFHIPAGWLLRVCVQESHRDPAIFPDPDRFDPDRFAGRGVSRRDYSPFGADDHGCMGVPVVQFFAQIFVEELCRGFDAQVTRNAPLERGTRHRDHWRPGTTRLVRLTPLESPRV